MFLDRGCNGYTFSYDEGDWVYRDRYGTASILHSRGVMLWPSREGCRRSRRAGRDWRLHDMGDARILGHYCRILASEGREFDL